MKLLRLFLPMMLLAALTTACENSKTPETRPTGNITLAAHAETITVGESITFTVMCEGVDVTDAAQIFMRSAELPQVENPYTPSTDGELEFYAVYGSAVSERIKVTVFPVIPDLPADAQPENTAFNHRILLVDHTGTQCGYCPQMMKALKQISENEAYHSKYYEAMSHTYNNNDPAGSNAASGVSNNYAITGYPTLTYNFRHSRTSSYDATDIMQQIDALWRADGAQAGIAAAASLAASKVIVNVEVKAAVAGEYAIAAWLLEDGIEATQSGATEDWMSIHNNAIRQWVISEDNNNDISGIKLGTIAAGETAEKVLELPIMSNKWNRDNFKVMLIASTPNSNGKFDVVNVTICEMNDVVTYDYK